MSTDANKEVVQRFINEVWNAENLHIADALIHPDYAIAGIGQGAEAVRRNVAAYRTAFPDLTCVIEQLVAEGEWVAVRLTLHGTHLGPLAGIAATGKRVTMQELVFWQVVEGKLRAIWSQGDSLGLRIQLGAIPASAWEQPVNQTEASN
jgi:steroid delta-isomerase-like uncharacterized protein